MNAVRFVAAILTAALAVYTVFAVANEGPNFVPMFLNDLTALGWTGQIFLDLVCYTTLSGLWIAWRHDFSPLGLVLGLIAVPGAWLFFGPYVLIASIAAEGDLVSLALGPTRAARAAHP